MQWTEATILGMTVFEPQVASRVLIVPQEFDQSFQDGAADFTKAG
jgi:hypothetical protein